MTDGSARVSYPSFLPNPTGYRERPCPRLMQTWAWLAKCHTEVYLASVFVTDVARTGNDENLRHRYSTCSECFPLNVPAHRNESGYLRTSSKTVSIATLHQPSRSLLSVVRCVQCQALPTPSFGRGPGDVLRLGRAATDNGQRTTDVCLRSLGGIRGFLLGGQDRQLVRTWGGSRVSSCWRA